MTTQAAAEARWARAGEERDARDAQHRVACKQAAANLRNMHEARAARAERFISWIIAEFDVAPDQLGPKSAIRPMLYNMSDEITHLTRDLRKGGRHAS